MPLRFLIARLFVKLVQGDGEGVVMFITLYPSPCTQTTLRGVLYRSAAKQVLLKVGHYLRKMHIANSAGFYEFNGEACNQKSKPQNISAS